MRKEKRSAQQLLSESSVILKGSRCLQTPFLFYSSLSFQAVGLVLVPNKVTSACMLQTETWFTTGKFPFRNHKIFLAGLARLWHIHNGRAIKDNYLFWKEGANSSNYPTMSEIVSVLILLKCWLIHLIFILQKFNQIPIIGTTYIVVVQHTVKERGRDYSSRRSFVFSWSGHSLKEWQYFSWSKGKWLFARRHTVLDPVS